jgi:hypothetical protein
MQPRALGRKASDELVVPLCRSHRRQPAGDERAFSILTRSKPRGSFGKTRASEGRMRPDRLAESTDLKRTARMDGVDTKAPPNRGPLCVPDLSMK